MKFKESKIYYTKNGVGVVVEFNTTTRNGKTHILPITPTQTKNVFSVDLLSRNIAHIRDCPIKAKRIKY